MRCQYQLPVVTTKRVSRHCHMFTGGRISLAWGEPSGRENSTLALRSSCPAQSNEYGWGIDSSYHGGSKVCFLYQEGSLISRNALDTGSSPRHYKRMCSGLTQTRIKSQLSGLTFYFMYCQRGFNPSKGRELRKDCSLQGGYGGGWLFLVVNLGRKKVSLGRKKVVNLGRKSPKHIAPSRGRSPTTVLPVLPSLVGNSSHPRQWGMRGMWGGPAEGLQSLLAEISQFWCRSSWLS